MINIKIDVNKIDKAKLFKGSKGTYLDVVLIETPDNQYGNDYLVIQSISKEERGQGIKGAILGNGKIFKSNVDGYQNQQNPTTEQSDETDDLPF